MVAGEAMKLHDGEQMLGQLKRHDRQQQGPYAAYCRGIA